MSTCGMYDYAGGWIYDVGMPAKSGVAGGIMAVLPGQLGIGVFSPPLDPKGNSVRGIAVCRELSEHFNLHLFHAVRSAASVIRASYCADKVQSKRARPLAAYEALRARGGCVRVYELHGDLVFGTTEIVLDDLMAAVEGTRYLLLDFKRVLSVDTAATRLLADLVRAVRGAGKQVLFTHTDHLYAFTRDLKRDLAGLDLPPLLGFGELDGGLEWCEEHLLEGAGSGESAGAAVALADNELARGLTAAELERLNGLLVRREYAPGELLIRRGELAENVYFLLAGEASILLPVTGGHYYRLATVSAGMYVGEMAMLDRKPRSADVRAETPVVCAALALTDIGGDAPELVALRAKLLHNLASGLARKVRQAHIEIRSLA
jgi:glutaminase